MTKITYTNTLAYEYHPERKGAKYTVDGRNKNGGQLIEMAIKHHHGYNEECPATLYDKGSDIPELKASVKSSKFSLACIYNDDFDEILKEYFNKVHSTLWIYAVKIDEEITEYRMNKEEFTEFVKTFGRLTKESGCNKMKIQGLATSGKMIKWFEARV